MNRYALTYDEIVNSLITNNKDKFINALPISDEQKQKYIDFFKSHSNLEGDIKSWQNKDKQVTIQDIENLIEKTSVTKEMKSGNASLINWDSHNCKYVGETQSFYWIMPLTWEGAKYCDSDVGGGKATWCIGWEKSDGYWNDYVERGSSFVMGIYKNSTDRLTDRKFMVQMFDEHTWVWDADNDEVIHEDGVINYWGQHGASSHDVTDIKKSAMKDFIKDFTVEFEQQVIDEFQKQQFEIKCKKN